MIKAFFQHIPRCLFEPAAILCVIGLVFFLYDHWKKDKAETLLLGMSVLFMIVWRVILPIHSDRYALLLIPVAIAATVYAIERTVFHCRRFLPPFSVPLHLCVMLTAFLVKSFCCNMEDKYMFEMIHRLKADAGDSNKTVYVTTNRDISVFLGDRFKIKHIDIKQQKHLSELPSGNYYLLKLNRKHQKIVPDIPNVSELQSITPRNGKSVFIIWKKESDIK